MSALFSEWAPNRSYNSLSSRQHYQLSRQTLVFINFPVWVSAGIFYWCYPRCCFHISSKVSRHMRVSLQPFKASGLEVVLLQHTQAYFFYLVVVFGNFAFDLASPQQKNINSLTKQSINNKLSLQIPSHLKFQNQKITSGDYSTQKAKTISIPKKYYNLEQSNSVLQKFYMLQSRVNKFASDYELQLCIQRTIPQSVQDISKSLQNQCDQVMKRHQLNLLYSYEELSADLLVLFHKITSYSDVVQNLLHGFAPCRKLSKVVQAVNSCFEKIFRFLKIHMQQKKNYTEQRLKSLESKFQSQAPGRCNRCRKFVLSRDIEETRILLTAGQFNDPFDLYDIGSSDFVNIRNKEDDEDYRLRFAEVWQNKKKIQEKLHMMQLQFDKRAYGCTYSAGQIQKIQGIIKGIVLQISNQQHPNLALQNKSFNKNMSLLINNIYTKLRQFRLNQNSKEEGVQVGEAQTYQFIQEMKSINEQTMKKNKDLSRKLSIKQRQLIDLSKKIEKMQQQLNISTLQKSSYETAMKSLLNKQVEFENQIYNESSNAKSYMKKVQQLQKQNQNLKVQIKKIYNHLETRKAEKKRTEKSTLKSAKSIGSKKYIKKSKIDINESQNQIIQSGLDRKDNKRVSVILQSLKKSLSDSSCASIEKDQEQKEDKFFDENIKHSKKHLEFTHSRKNIKQAPELKEQSSLQVARVIEENQVEQTNRQTHTQISIQILKTQHNLELFKSTSSKRIKNGAISLKRIKKKPSIIEKEQIQNQKDQKQEQGCNQNKNESIENGQIIKKSSKSKQNKVNFKSQFEKKVEKGQKSHGNKITERDSQSQLQHSKIRESSNKFHSLYTSKSSLKSHQNQINSKNPSKLLKSKTNSIKKKSYKTSLQNSRQLQKKTQQITPIKAQGQEVLNKKELDSMISTLPYIFNTQKLEKIQIGNKKQKNSKQACLQFYEFYKKLVDQQNQQNPSGNKKMYQFQQFQMCIKNFIQFMAKENGSQIKCYYLPQIITQVSLEKAIFNRNKAYKHESLHSTSTHNLSGQSVRQWKNKLQYWKWAGGSSIKSKWARRQVNINSLNNTYNCEDIKQYSELSQMQITEIKTKIGKLYFSSQFAYELQKSHPTSMSANLNFSLSNFKGPKNNNEVPAQLASILSKNEIKYLKIVTILLAKLHHKNNCVYQTVKKSILFPYSFLGDGLVMPSVQLKKLKRQRKTVGSDSIAQEKQNSSLLNDSALLSQSIIKLLVLHRKCIKPKQQTPKEQSGNKRKESCASTSSMSLYERCICKHLIQFQSHVEKEFGKESVMEEKLEKDQRFNQTDMGKHQY